MELQALGFIFLDPSLPVPEWVYRATICVLGCSFMCEGKALFVIVKRKIFHFSEMLFSENENVLRCLAASEIVLPKINFGVWFVQTFYGKWLSFYRKSIFMFGSVKHFTENEIRFLRKINSHVWFMDHFTKNNNFKHLHYLNKPATVQKYSSTST